MSCLYLFLFSARAHAQHISLVSMGLLYVTGPHKRKCDPRCITSHSFKRELSHVFDGDEDRYENISGFFYEHCFFSYEA